MTALALATFAASERGAEYATVHKFWGTDPAEGIEDPVLAYSFRHALAVCFPDDEEPKTDPVERTRAAAQALKEGRWPAS